MATEAELERGRQLLREMGFPAEKWTDQEVEARLQAMVAATRQIAKAIQPVFPRIGQDFAAACRNLAKVGALIEQAEAEVRARSRRSPRG